MSGVAVVIVAAGQGARAGDGPPKAYRPIGGVAMLRRTLEAFAGRAEISHNVVVIAPEHRAHFTAAVAGLEPAPVAVDGGATRSQSVRNGLEALAEHDPEFVLIHDAARPFVSTGLIDRVEAALLTADAVVPALPVADALKALEADGSLGADAPRASLRAVQTPQGFRYAPLLAAFRALSEDADFTDDAAVARSASMSVRGVPGERENVKLTYPEDFAAVEAARERPPASRSGTASTPTASDPRMMRGAMA
jgi:2-C-methyl-D-erythritol 4-phosphate cytidylyltransferase/2-C-methyl-D-erythritol 2,4-cyclodiphosphate synthase